MSRHSRHSVGDPGDISTPLSTRYAKRPVIPARLPAWGVPRNIISLVIAAYATSSRLTPHSSWTEYRQCLSGPPEAAATSYTPVGQKLALQRPATVSHQKYPKRDCRFNQRLEGIFLRLWERLDLVLTRFGGSMSRRLHLIAGAPPSSFVAHNSVGKRRLHARAVRGTVTPLREDAIRFKTTSKPLLFPCLMLHVHVWMRCGTDAQHRGRT